MGDRPQVTVLMSVYNGLPYLNEAIESVICQTFHDFEFLIIDDGSTDQSRDILRTWADRDGRIRLICHDESEGLGCRLAEGLEAARAPWVARMDDDDICLPDRLERQVAYLKANPSVDILSGWAIDCDEDGQPLRIRQVPVSHEEIVRLIWTIPIVHPAVIFRRDAILEAGSYAPKLQRRQDYDLWFRCAATGLRFANLPEPLIYYRFTDEYYERNDLEVAWKQACIGWRGCRLVGAGPAAYLGVTVPLVRTLLPACLGKAMHRFMNMFDPRQCNDGQAGSMEVEEMLNKAGPDGRPRVKKARQLL